MRLLLQFQLLVLVPLALSVAGVAPGRAEQREVYVTLDLLSCARQDQPGELRVTADVARDRSAPRHRDVWSGDVFDEAHTPLTQLLVWNGTLATGEKATIEIGVENDSERRSVRTLLLSASIRGVKDYITSKVPGYLAGAVADGISSVLTFWRPAPPPERPSSFMLVIENTAAGIEARLHPRHRSHLVDDRLQIGNGDHLWLGVPRVNGTAIGSSPCECNPAPQLASVSPDPAPSSRGSME